MIGTPEILEIIGSDELEAWRGDGRIAQNVEIFLSEVATDIQRVAGTSIGVLRTDVFEIDDHRPSRIKFAFEEGSGLIEARIIGIPIADVVRLKREYVHDSDSVWVMRDGKLEIRRTEVVHRDPYVKRVLQHQVLGYPRRLCDGIRDQVINVRWKSHRSSFQRRLPLNSRSGVGWVIRTVC